MSAHATNITANPDVETLGGTATRNVVVLAFQTVPHGVRAEWRVPEVGFDPSQTDQYVEALAIGIEELFGNPGIADVAWTQVTTPSQQLKDALLIYVTSTSGESSAVLTIPYPPFDAPAMEAAAAAKQQELDQIEAA